MLLGNSPYLNATGILAQAKDKHKVAIADAILERQQHSLFQRAICSFLANVLSDTDSVKHLRQVFRELDTDQSGSINRAEFKKGVPKMKVKGLNARNADEIFGDID